MKMRQRRKVIFDRIRRGKRFYWYIEKVKLAMVSGAQRMSMALQEVYTKTALQRLNKAAEDNGEEL